MTTPRFAAVLAVTGLVQLPALADAEERKAAEVACKPVEHRALVYDCTIVLKGRKSGTPIVDAEFMVGADMPSMPAAHNVRPVPAAALGEPGVYRFRIALEMKGEWALKLDFTKPSRDRLVKKLHFGGTKAHGE